MRSNNFKSNSLEVKMAKIRITVVSGIISEMTFWTALLYTTVLFPVLFPMPHSSASDSLTNKLGKTIIGYEERNASSEVQPTEEHFNSSTKLKSSFKRNEVVLTLDLRPKETSSFMQKMSNSHASNSNYTTTVDGNHLSMPGLRVLKIIDRLSELTNKKLRKAVTSKLINRNGSTSKPNLESFPSGTLSNFENSTLPKTSAELRSRSNPHALLPDPSAVLNRGRTNENDIDSIPKAGSDLFQLTEGNNTNASNEYANTTSWGKLLPDMNTHSVDEDSQEHLIEESRVITADQIGGNRPTRVPFHFTTTPIPPSTSASSSVSNIPTPNRFQKVVSPHNHIFAPTQDPISIAHGEDVNGEDLQDFHAAHLTFGTKVGFTASTTPGYKSQFPTIGVSGSKQTTLPVRDLRQKPSFSARSQPSPSPSLPSIDPPVKKTNNINDQLPFFKEQGGIFEHQQQPNFQSEPNEIQIQEKIAGVTYASKGPAAQPQTNVYSSPKQNQLLHTLQPPSPHYVQIPQQQLYLAPVPVQQVVQPYGHNPVPQNYYNQPVAAFPVHVPAYYPNPTPHGHNQNQHNPQPQPLSLGPQFTNTGFIPIKPNYQQSVSPQPVSSQKVTNAKNAYYTPSRENRDPYLHENGRPPPREDPESDTFYGNPISAPPRSKQPKSAVIKQSIPRRKSANRKSYTEDDEYQQQPPIYKKRQHINSPPRRHESLSTNRGNKNVYGAEQNENIHEVIPPAPLRRNPTNPRVPDDEYERPSGSFYQPSPDDYSFPRLPSARPNFEHPNIHFDRRNSVHGERTPQPAGPRRGRNNFDGNDNEPEHAAVGESLERNVPTLDPIYTRTIKQYDEERLKPETSPAFAQDDDGHERDESERDEQPRRFSPRPSTAGYHSEADSQDEDESAPVEDEETEEEERKPNSRRQPQHDEEPAEEEDDEETQQKPSKRTKEDRDEEEEEEEEESQQKPSKRTKEEDEEEEEEETQQKPSKRAKEDGDEEEEEETQQNPSKRSKADEEEEEEEEEEPKKQQRGKKKPPPRKPKDEKTGNLDDDIAGIERDFGSFGFGGGNDGSPHNVQYHPVLG